MVKRWTKRAWLKVRLAGNRSPKIVVGAGSISMSGWIPTEHDQLDLTVEADWLRYFREGSIHSMLAEHVWEHLSQNRGLEAARLCLRFLKRGGRLRVAVPDGLHPDPAYIEAVRPGGSGPGAEDHKVLYTSGTLQSLFENAGFKVQLLEHFDEAGKFHANEWDAADGLVRRSRRFDERNKNGQLIYTSIVLDAIKP
jgi:predicted SAM-dependent methyltransferase